MARRIKERELKNPTITIIGEGATERYYFTHLKPQNKCQLNWCEFYTFHNIVYGVKCIQITIFI